MMHTQRVINDQRDLSGVPGGGARGPEAVRVELLGGFRMSVGTRTIEQHEWHLRKAGSLIKLLALAPQHRLHRERLMDLLWPNLGPEAAANNLRRALHFARRTLESAPAPASRYLCFQGELVVFCPSSLLWVDVEAFKFAAARARRSRDPTAYRAAVDLYGGDLLPEDRYEAWTEERREGLRLIYLSLLVELAGLYEEREEFGPAVESLRQVVAAEPRHEEAHASLMRLYIRSGQRHQALRQYERLRQALRQGLSVEPNEDTQRLYEEIVAGCTPTTEPSPADSTPEEQITFGGRHNLPTLRTSFVGRERELVELKRLLSMTQLLTLTGAGGSGKTRLALEVARELIGVYRDGVWLVELAGLAEGELVPQTVAEALKIREQPNRLLTEILVNSLGARQMLLVLDNCEHLIDTCAQLTDTLLNSCPRLRVLATSREPLNVAGEVTWRMPSLSVPDTDRLPRAGELTRYDAVRLFLNRAQLQQPSFGLTPENALSVAEVSRKLEGIPLAIELAAARIRTLSVGQISARLSDSLKLLTGGSRTTTRRQRTLRGALDWSYELLSEPEQTLFGRLSVFAGGWELKAAEAVGAGGDIGKGDVLDLLSRLGDKSLVETQAAGEDGARFRMLEPARQYAQERLEESGEAAAARSRHAAFFLALAEKAQSEQGPRQGAWLEQLEREHDNLRAALSWSLDAEDAEHEERTELGLRLATALATARFWNAYGPREGLEWLERGLAKNSMSSTSVRIMALSEAGHIATSQNDYQKAVALLEEDFALCKEVGDEAGTTFALNNLLYAAYHRGDHEHAETIGRQAECLLQEVTDRHATANLLHVLGIIEVGSRRNHERAIELVEKSLNLYQELGDMRGIAQSFTMMWVSALQQGKYQWAATLLKKDLRVLQELRDKVGTSYALLGSAVVATSEEQPACAARLWGAAEALREVIGLPLTPFARAMCRYESHLAAARSQLDEEAWEAAWAEGRQMTPEQAVEYALSDEKSAPGAPSVSEEPSAGRQLA